MKISVQTVDKTNIIDEAIQNIEIILYLDSIPFNFLKSTTLLIATAKGPNVNIE